MPSFTKALPRLGGGLVPKPAVSVTDSGKSDLLMRFFESDWFDAWIALTYGARGSEGCSGVEVAGGASCETFWNRLGAPWGMGLAGVAGGHVMGGALAWSFKAV